MSQNKLKPLTGVVSDTDWGISTPFGNMIQAIQGKSPLPMRAKYMKYISLAGQMNGIISFYFGCSFLQHSSSTYITIVNALNLLICSNEQLNHWHTSCITFRRAILSNYFAFDSELLEQQITRFIPGIRSRVSISCSIAFTFAVCIFLTGI